MTLDEIMKISNSYTDEVVTAANAIRYANECLALINSKHSTDLPYFDDATTEYIALNDAWTRRLLVPYLNYSVKMNDSSLNEAGEYKSTFYEALVDFGNVFLDVLSVDYLGDAIGVYEIDTEAAVNMGWFYNRGSGGL